jgi:hypothetical protein
MKRLLTSIIICYLASLFTVFASDGSHTALPPKQPIKDLRELNADEQKIQRLLDLYAEAIEEKSLEKAKRAILSNDFVIIESGYPNWQWEDFRDNHLLVEMKDFSEISYQMELIAGELQEKLGFGIYAYKASGKFRGKATSISGFATALLEKDQNEWRIHHIHSSAPRNQLEKNSYGQ